MSKKFLGIVIIVMGILGITGVILHFVFQQRSRIGVVDKNHFRVEIFGTDGWVDTGIPVIGNQKINLISEDGTNFSIMINGKKDMLNINYRQEANIEIPDLPELKDTISMKTLNNTKYDLAKVTIRLIDLPCTNEKHSHSEAKEWATNRMADLSEK